MAKEYLDLQQLLLNIQESVENAFPGRYWVKAEIFSLNSKDNGHCYLTLSETVHGKRVAEVRAIIWSSRFSQLKAFFEKATGQPLQAGITVLVRVQVSLSQRYGFALFIDDIDPAFTVGAQAMEKKKTLERLQAGGYLEMQQELSLPDLPGRLAVITSRTAAGYGDFCRHLLENEAGYAFDVELFEALMQGDQAPASIIAALQEAQLRPFDAVLILRGGGSEMDLSCFDDFDLAVAIATCPVPVVTAIGHERDFHIADQVANRYVKTPTALADLFLEAYAKADAAVEEALLRIRRSVEQRFASEQHRLQERFHGVRLAILRRVSTLESGLQRSAARVARGLSRKVSDAARLTDAAVHRVQFAAGARIGTEISSVALKEALIKASDPRSILALGYVLVTGEDHKILKTVSRVSRGDSIGVRFSDGSLVARVEAVYSEHIDNNKTNIA